MKWVMLAGTVIASVCAIMSPAVAKIYMTDTFDLIEQSNLIVVGTVQSVNDQAFRVVVTEILDGKRVGKTIAVTPSTMESCLGRSVNYYPGEELLLLLDDNGTDEFQVIGNGRGKVVLRCDETHARLNLNIYRESRQARIESVRKLIPIARLKDEDAKNKILEQLKTP